MGLSRSLEGFKIVPKVAGALPGNCGWGRVVQPWDKKKLLETVMDSHKKLK
jgi:hypothetical protein